MMMMIMMMMTTTTTMMMMMMTMILSPTQTYFGPADEAVEYFTQAKLGFRRIVMMMVMPMLMMPMMMMMMMMTMMMLTWQTFGPAAERSSTSPRPNWASG
jgi:hypothetical protein